MLRFTFGFYSLLFGACTSQGMAGGIDRRVHCALTSISAKITEPKERNISCRLATNIAMSYECFEKAWSDQNRYYSVRAFSFKRQMSVSPKTEGEFVSSLFGPNGQSSEYVLRTFDQKYNIHVTGGELLPVGVSSGLPAVEKVAHLLANNYRKSASC